MSCPLGACQGRSCDGRGRGGSGAASHGEGKVNSCRAVIMRRVGVAGQLRPCPSPTGTICDQAQLCLPYQPFRSDFPTTSPSRRPHFLTARGWRGTAGLARHGTARQGCPGAPRGTAQAAWQGVAWLAFCSLAQTRGSPPLAAALFPGLTHGMRFSSCPDLQLQHHLDLLSTWGDPPVPPSLHPPGQAPQHRLPRSCQRERNNLLETRKAALGCRWEGGNVS